MTGAPGDAPSRPQHAGPEAPAAEALNVHFHQLAGLRELARRGTLTEAAAALHVTQPALSQSLAQLERRVGVALLERDGRRRRLTEAGQELARFAEETLGRAAELQRWLLAHRAGESGTLRVGMIDAASLYFLPGTIREFRAAHPAVQLRLLVADSAALLRRLQGFELDLAFVVGPVEGEFESAAVAREPLHLYAPPGASEQPQQGAWVLYPAGSRTRTLIDEGLERLGMQPQVILESSNPEVLRQMVSLGLCWSVLPPGVAEDGAAPLAPYRREAVAERVLVGVRRRGAPPDERAEAFLGLARRAQR
ncbi:MAG: LysR family transcriptional regulator [Dehalococcoidia bacterium]|nr:LysR family transcriptional regulator [Dehalococcoidia bacterium]